MIPYSAPIKRWSPCTRWENPTLELLPVCIEEGIWLHKTSLPKTCMLSCLPGSCWSACLTLVVSGSLCAELITGYDISMENQIGDNYIFGWWWETILFLLLKYYIVWIRVVMEKKIKNTGFYGWGGKSGHFIVVWQTLVINFLMTLYTL